MWRRGWVGDEWTIHAVVAIVQFVGGIIHVACTAGETNQNASCKVFAIHADDVIVGRQVVEEVVAVGVGQVKGDPVVGAVADHAKIVRLAICIGVQIQTNARIDDRSFRAVSIPSLTTPPPAAHVKPQAIADAARRTDKAKVHGQVAVVIRLTKRTDVVRSVVAGVC